MKRIVIAALCISVIMSGCEKQSPSGDVPGDRQADNESAKMVPLKIEYPEPMNDNDPWYENSVDRSLDPVEEPPVVLVPPDVTNLAKGKPVTCSEKDERYIVGEYIDTDDVLSIITDGDKKGEKFLEIFADKEPIYITIDLERECEIYAVAWWNCFNPVAVYEEVLVQVSKDSEFKDARILFNNDKFNSLGFGKGSDPYYIDTNKGWVAGTDGVKGRYIRLYNSCSNVTMSRFTEVEVYGRLSKQGLGSNITAR